MPAIVPGNDAPGNAELLQEDMATALVGAPMALLLLSGWHDCQIRALENPARSA